MTALTDHMDAASEEAYDAAMYALQLKHEGGDKREQAEAEQLAAKRRRDHRTLFIKALFSLTGSAEPDLGEPDPVTLVKRMVA